MTNQAKDRYGILITVLDVINEEIEKQKKTHENYESCPVCERVIRKVRLAMLEEQEVIIEDYRTHYGFVTAKA